mgnify:CR=1 FL=1
MAESRDEPLLERDLDAWRERANDEVFVIVQIESAKAVENGDAIEVRA